MILKIRRVQLRDGATSTTVTELRTERGHGLFLPAPVKNLKATPIGTGVWFVST